MTELNQPSWNGYVNLVTIDLRPFGTSANPESVYGFIDSNNSTDGVPFLDEITWQGQSFEPLPISVTGFDRSGENKAAPTINVPDFGAGMFVTLMNYNLASGAAVTRYQALASDVLADDPNAPFMIEKYLLKNVSYDGMTLQLMLATHLDYQNNQFPSHIMFRTEYPGLGSNLAR